ncbi:hypothetical protein AJ80_00006 [Polytolypa hystricis UAMH7299]|uniref:J domain-containing protein n=1 Tax=Polytolypa hystricis (strain UAMH7299) TaxID=1447883 RepID=A0A2B7Z2G7_POLH7|nr:hypothetical protein AJ80_00006 [Polytolypa hystricis UAMH7299]
MVKVDVKKDYYADLGLTPNVETSEIRKQFRRLALKYHPDRNPGREREFNGKFQAIQTAHEILTDPQQRLKYDTDRLRAGYGKLYGPSKPVAPPRQQQYPNVPQPRRAPTSQQHQQQQQQQQQPSPGAYPPPPSTGAQKYASYAKAGTQRWEKVYEEARTRADAYRGFQDMKPNPGWSGFDPRTGRSNQGGKPETTSTPDPHGQRPQSAYDPFFAAHKRTQSTKKKHGFAPGTPGGDEPMAQNTSAYVNVSRGARAQASYPQQPPFESAPHPTAKKEQQTPVGPTLNLERVRTQYATTGGEKTYVSSSGLWRSASVRQTPSTEPDSRSRTNPPSPTAQQSPRGRHHSASPKLKPNRNRTFSPSTESSDSDDVVLQSRRKATPHSRRFAKGAKNAHFDIPDSGEAFIPRATGPNSRHFAPNTPRRGEAQAYNPDDVGWDEEANPQGCKGHNSDNTAFQPRRSTQAASSKPTSTSTSQPVFAAPTGPTAAGPASSNTPQEQSNGINNSSNMYDPSPKFSALNWSKQWGFSPTSTGDTPRQIPLWAYPSSILPQGWASEAQKTKPSTQAVRGVNVEKDPLDGSGRPNPNPLHSGDPDSSKMKTDTHTPFRFSQSTANTTPSKRPLDERSKSRSNDSIEVVFSAEDWNGKFQSGAGFFTPKPINAQYGLSNKSNTARGRSSSRPHAASQSQRPSVSREPIIQQQTKQTSSSQEPTSNSTASQPKPVFVEAKFSADKWSEELKNNVWTIPHTDIPQQQSADTHRQKSPRKQAKPVSKRTTVPKPATVTTEDDEAGATLYNGAGVEVKPGENGGEAMDIDSSPFGKGEIPATTEGMSKPAAASTAAPADKKPKSNLFNLKDLGVVSPFTTNNTGINDLNDLNSMLPFDSRPDTSTTRVNVKPQDLKLPKPPRAPSPPKLVLVETLIQGSNKAETIMTPAAWERYIAEMSAYIYEWNRFNHTMLAHFNARQTTVETGLSPRWMSAVGDTGRLNIDNGTASFDSASNNKDDEQLVAGTTKGGFNAYLRGVEEDFVVRKHWEVAWEKHRECILTLGRVREWIRNGGKIRPLPEVAAQK